MKGLCENCCEQGATHLAYTYNEGEQTPLCDDCWDAWQMTLDEQDQENNQ